MAPRNRQARYVLTANTLQRLIFFGMFAYLAAYLIESYHMLAGDTAPPRALAGSGAIVGGGLGGWVTGQRRRLALVALSCVGSGLLAALVFSTPISPWATATLACGAAALTGPSLTVTPTLLMELAGSSRTTATGLFAVSNQLGAFGGSALGGVMLALGGFLYVGLCCLGVSVIAAVVVWLKVRDSAAFLAQLAPQQGTTDQPHTDT